MSKPLLHHLDPSGLEPGSIEEELRRGVPKSVLADLGYSALAQAAATETPPLDLRSPDLTPEDDERFDLLVDNGGRNPTEARKMLACVSVPTRKVSETRGSTGASRPPAKSTPQRRKLTRPLTWRERLTADKIPYHPED